MTKKTNVLPAVLSYKRSLVISDGVFSSVEKNNVTGPIRIKNITNSCLQNQAKGKDNGEVRNIQTVQVAKLSSTSNVLNVSFSMKPIDIRNGFHQADDLEYILHVKDAIYTSVLNNNDEALNETTKRIAINILNGRWLWRNRICAESIEISVSVNGEPIIANFDARQLSLNSFDDTSDIVNTLQQTLLNGWTGKTHDTIKVSATLDIGVPGAEVYPSQMFATTKNISRVLFSVGEDYAAFRAEKIWNALRTIDTWYPEYDTTQTPIAVEPVGASLYFKKKFRTSKGQDIYTLLELLVKGYEENEWESLDFGQKCFITMCLIQGGVFGKKGE